MYQFDIVKFSKKKKSMMVEKKKNKLEVLEKFLLLVLNDLVLLEHFQNLICQLNLLTIEEYLDIELLRS
jgi:hypothetical protein